MASQRIKGITIEIGGDTSELTKALSNVDKAVKETQTNLRDINKALKYDTGNVDLLKIKQENLNSSVDLAKQKLQAEKEALDQMRNTDGFDANSKAAKDLQTQIALDEAELKKAEQELKDFGSVGQQQMQIVADKVKALGDKISSVGEGLTKAITVPIMGVGAASVAAWQEVDSAMDIVVTKTGATGDALEDLQSRVTNIAETIPTSFENAGTAIGEVNTRFGITGDELEALSTQFIEFADINGTDVNGAIDTVQKTLAAFGLETKDAGALLDTLNKVGQDTGISMDTLASLMTSNATAFQSMGLDAADAAVLLGKLEKSGVDTSTAITGLTKVQKNAAAEGISMQDSLNAALTDVNSAIDVFGAKAGVKLYESFHNGTLSVQDFLDTSANLGDALGSVSDTYQATLDPLDQMQVTLNTLKQTGADIVNAAAPMLTQAMQALSDVVKQLADAWNGLTPAQQEMIIKIAAVAAAIGPVLVVVGKVVSAVGTLMPMITALGGVLAGISAPILAVVAAVAALAAGFVYLYQTNEEFRDKVTELVEGVKENFNNMVETIKPVFEELFTTIKTIIQEIVEGFKQFMEDAKPVFEFIATGITGIVNGVMAAATPILQAVNSVIKTVTEVVKALFSLLKGDFSGFADHLKNALGNLLNAIKSLIEAKLAFFKGLFSTFGVDIVAKARQWGVDMINNLISGIQSMIGKVGDAIKSVADVISSYIHFSLPEKGPLHKLNTFMPDMMEQLSKGIIKGIPEVESALNSLTSNMANGMQPNMSAQGANMAAGGVSNTTNTNTVNINVYGAQGQDVNELANKVQDIINNQIYSKGAVFA